VFESLYRLSEKANWLRTPVSGATVSDNDALRQLEIDLSLARR